MRSLMRRCWVWSVNSFHISQWLRESSTLLRRLSFPEKSEQWPHCMRLLKTILMGRKPPPLDSEQDLSRTVTPNIKYLSLLIWVSINTCEFAWQTSAESTTSLLQLFLILWIPPKYSWQRQAFCGALKNQFSVNWMQQCCQAWRNLSLI